MNPNLHSLRVFQTSADYADYAARWQVNHGDPALASQFLRRRDRLVTEVDLLWNQLFDDWSAEAKSLTTQAKTKNNALEKELKKLESTVTHAQAALQALALLDQLLDLAKEIAP